MSMLTPTNLPNWIEEHRHLLKPPVGNQYLYDGKDFFVMIIAGPNARNDYHVSASEEFFYQIKGDIIVRIRQNGKVVDHQVKEGDTFFIPSNVPHSPQRPPNTIGMVVERTRPTGETEHMLFYCELEKQPQLIEKMKSLGLKKVNCSFYNHGPKILNLYDFVTSDN